VKGLWLLQECRRTWAAQGQQWDDEALVRLAEAAPPLRSLIDPDDPRFLPPGEMPARIQAFCQETGQPIPEEPAEIVRCILESLALKYRWVIERLEALLARPIPCIPVVGGGSRHALLCQWTADAAGRPVLAGPTEATALGNPIVQAMAPGHLSDLPEAREVIRRSSAPLLYEPRASSAREEAYQRLVARILPA
jgi:rhamnulokinase